MRNDAVWVRGVTGIQLHHTTDLQDAGRFLGNAAMALRAAHVRTGDDRYSDLATQLKDVLVLARELEDEARAGLVEDEVVGSHIRALMGAQPFDIASSDRHTVKPWFNGRIVQSPRVVDLAAEGFPLVGGRIDVIARIPVPSLVYRYQKHLISVTATQGLGAPPRGRAADGYHLIGWTDGGVSYWAVSDVGVHELEKFVQLFRNAPTDG